MSDSPEILRGPLQQIISDFNQARYDKVLKFWQKKQQRSFVRKIVSKRRKKVADTKLRIKGKFVTIEQAIKLIGKR
jgi:hypothetical protein